MKSVTAPLPLYKRCYPPMSVRSQDNYANACPQGRKILNRHPHWGNIHSRNGYVTHARLARIRMAAVPTDLAQLKTDQVQGYLHDSIGVPGDLQNNVLVTTLDKIYNWSRKSSMWPLLFGLACCAIEMIATAASRYDLSRFGMEVMRPSPRQSDLMIVSGTVTKKMVPAIVRIYNQMAEPRYVLSMGACATGGGPFKEGYNVVSGIDKYIPVGCLCARVPAHPGSVDFRPDETA